MLKGPSAGSQLNPQFAIQVRYPKNLEFTVQAMKNALLTPDFDD
jgi:hypothetical protein